VAEALGSEAVAGKRHGQEGGLCAKRKIHAENHVSSRRGGFIRQCDQKTPHIGSVLTGLIGGLRPEAEQGMLGIWKVWDRAAGDEVARNARPAAFKWSILWCTSPAPPGSITCSFRNRS